MARKNQQRSLRQAAERAALQQETSVGATAPAAIPRRVESQGKPCQAELRPAFVAGITPRPRSAI